MLAPSCACIAPVFPYLGPQSPHLVPVSCLCLFEQTSSRTPKPCVLLYFYYIRMVKKIHYILYTWIHNFIHIHIHFIIVEIAFTDLCGFDVWKVNEWPIGWMIYLFLDYLVGPKENPGKKRKKEELEGFKDEGGKVW